MTNFPWPDLFRLALSVGITPDIAWEMTPCALFSIMDLTALPAAQTIKRADFIKLAAQFPDTPTE